MSTTDSSNASRKKFRIFGFSTLQKTYIGSSLVLLLILEIVYGYSHMWEFSLLTFIPSIIIAFSVAWIVQRVRHPGTYLVLSVLHALIFLTYEYIVMRVGFGSSLTFWYILKKI